MDMLQERTERIRTGFVFTLLCCAVLVRLILAFGAAAAQPEQPEAQPPGQAAEKTLLRPRPAPEPESESAGETEQTQEPEPAALPTEAPALSFTAEDAARVRIGGACSYPADAAQALQEVWRVPSDAAPTVLIVHTHGTEAYTAEEGWTYSGQEGQRTEDPEYSVVRVGRELAAQLEQLGVRVIHDETMNDRESFSGAYAASRGVAQEHLAEESGISMVIDLHRDAAQNPDGSAFAPVSVFSGTEYARLMLVVGTDEGGLEHPDWRKNLGCAAQLQALLERNWPGLARDVDLRTERFNQDLSPGAILIEVGAAGNTLRQAMQSMTPLAGAIAALLQAA